MIAGYNSQITTASYSGTVDNAIPVFVSPFGGATITNVYGFVTGAVVAHASNYVLATVLNGGTAGTATTSIGSAAGTAVGWAADTKTAYTLNTALTALSPGEVLMVNFDLNGTIAPGTLTTVVEWVRGG